MSFQPVIPFGGVAGWAFLKRTQHRQEEAFAQSATLNRTTSTFTEAFGKIGTSEELVGNRPVLSLVLGAYGLKEDLENTAFVKRVISDGTRDRNALANRLADKRYLSLATDLAHLASGGTGSAPEGLAERLIRGYRAAEFEIAVGDSNEAMRFSLSFARKMPEIAVGLTTDGARWFQILGDPPTRQVLETALGLPKEFAALNIDEQVKRMKGAAAKQFGTDSVQALAAPEMVATITERFLLMDQLRETQASMSGAAVALTLLSDMNT